MWRVRAHVMRAQSGFAARLVTCFPPSLIALLCCLAAVLNDFLVLWASFLLRLSHLAGQVFFLVRWLSQGQELSRPSWSPE